MDKYTATEQAYKNGYEAGYQKAQNDTATEILRHLKKWYLYEDSRMLGDVLTELERRYIK